MYQEPRLGCSNALHNIKPCYKILSQKNFTLFTFVNAVQMSKTVLKTAYPKTADSISFHAVKLIIFSAKLLIILFPRTDQLTEIPLLTSPGDQEIPALTGKIK